MSLAHYTISPKNSPSIFYLNSHFHLLVLNKKERKKERKERLDSQPKSCTMRPGPEPGMTKKEGRTCTTKEWHYEIRPLHPHISVELLFSFVSIKKGKTGRFYGHPCPNLHEAHRVPRIPAFAGMTKKDRNNK